MTIPIFPEAELYGVNEPESLNADTPWQAAEEYLDGAIAWTKGMSAELARPSPPPEVERGKCGECDRQKFTVPGHNCRGTGREGTNG